MYWLYVLVLVAILALSITVIVRNWSTFWSARWWYAAGSTIATGLALTSFVLLCLAFFNSGRTSAKDVILTQITSTTTNTGGEVELEGVNLNRGMESFTCNDPDLVKRCAQLQVGDRVVVTRNYDEFGFANPPQISFTNRG